MYKHRNGSTIKRIVLKCTGVTDFDLILIGRWKRIKRKVYLMLISSTIKAESLNFNSNLKIWKTASVASKADEVTLFLDRLIRDGDLKTLKGKKRNKIEEDIYVCIDLKSRETGAFDNIGAHLIRCAKASGYVN